MAYHTNFDDLCKLILQTIEEEQFFNKQTLIPKVRALLNGFHLNTNTTNYNNLKRKTESATFIRTIEKKDIEVKYWKDSFKKLYPHHLNNHYDELKRILIENGFEQIDNRDKRGKNT